jgi:hypothetical protein
MTIAKGIFWLSSSHMFFESVLLKILFYCNLKETKNEQERKNRLSETWALAVKDRNSWRAMITALLKVSTGNFWKKDINISTIQHADDWLWLRHQYQ